MRTKPAILIVDDNRSDLFLLEEHLKEWGYTALAVNSGVEAIERLQTQTVDLIVSDQRMDGMDGMELLQRVKQASPTLPFIILTIERDISTVVGAMKQGADDYLTKPYNPDEVRAKIERLLGYPWLLREDRKWAEGSSNLPGFRDIITCSPKMQAVLKLALQVAQRPKMTILLYGESGTGKELLARAIHYATTKSEQKFVGVNCAGIPSSLLESELFGHVKGAFTGADRDREGKFAIAGKGTLLLDEIGDMPVDLQAKLLRVLQERTYEKVGSNKPEKVECRVIVATHKNLKRLIENGQFRQDLYYRINDFPVTIPPLRERKEDIPVLVNHFVERFRREQNKYIPGIATEAMESLFNYHWPGNVRELQKCMEQAVMLVDEGPIKPLHLPAIPKSSQICDDATGMKSGLSVGKESVRLVFESSREQFSLEGLIAYTKQLALKMCADNKVQAAKLLKVNRKRYYREKIE